VGFIKQHGQGPGFSPLRDIQGMAESLAALLDRKAVSRAPPRSARVDGRCGEVMVDFNMYPLVN